ncbi:MAG: NAD(P)/FAD-dependent oxidoreductase [Christensenellaceae bacterium]|jgi:NADPH-dependent 2,4-dienoyl-CoA reductase/sulfur reductase-like enzyme
MQKIDLLIIGGGPAGLAAAISAKKAGVENLLILERDAILGGILQQCIHNGFGLQIFSEELTGPEYAARYIAEAKEMEIPYLCNTMVIDITSKKHVTAVSKEQGMLFFEAKAIMLAMGCRERSRGALAIPGARPSGIYSAGTAQRFINLEGFLPGREVVILGSGDIGLIMARRMTYEGCKVKACVEIMPYSSGLTRNIVQCLDDYDIPLLLNHTVIDIKGKERLERVTIAEVDENRKPKPETATEIACDTLLLSVGLIPENELSLLAGISLSPVTGGPVVTGQLETTVPGIFAAGNVLHVHDLVDFVSAEAEAAGANAAAYIKGSADFSGKQVPVLDGTSVLGCVPQFLSYAQEMPPVRIMFRPTGVFEKKRICVWFDEVPVLVSRIHRVLAPGEMAAIELPSALFADHPAPASVKISLEEASFHV